MNVDPNTLPRGVVYRFKADRPDAPHQFGVRDKRLRTYAWQSFSNRDRGMAWAKGALDDFKANKRSSARPLTEDIGKAYMAGLKGQGGSAAYEVQVQEIIDDLIRIGARDMSAPDFAEIVQDWLTNLMACRPGQKVPTVAAPRTKRRKLTIARALVHFAMAMPGKPLKEDPLSQIHTPKVQRHDKPVFTLDELRTLLSDDCRYLGKRLREETEQAVAAAGGDKRKAAKALGVHLATVYNRLNTPPQEDGWWLYFALALYTGARPSEVQYMKWEWVQWDQRLIELPADAPGNKMDVARLIPIQAELMAILRERFKVGMTGYILPVEVTRVADWRHQSFQSYMTRCGVPLNGRGPHSLRHQHGALAVAMKMHPTHLMMNQGWENPKVAADYQRTATRFRRDVASWGSEDFRFREFQESASAAMAAS